MPTNIYQRTAIALAVAACFPAPALGNAARIDFAVGNVTATGPDGKSRTLTRGAEISQGDTVSTQNGRAQLRFADGAYMSLQPQTEFKIEEFNFAGKEDGKEGIVMNLIKGGMRTITGLIGRTNRSSYKLKTEVATIGIRGTEYSVQYTNSIDVFCAGGSINLENQGGSLTISGGQGAQVQSQNTAPQQTSQPPVLSPTSTTQQKQEEEHTRVADPTDPELDAKKTCDPSKETCSVEEALGVQVQTQTVQTVASAPKLTGKFTGNWAVSHIGNGLDRQLGRDIELNAAGGLIAFVDVNEVPGTNQLGTATLESQGNDGIVAWGRWVAPGTPSGTGGQYSGASLVGEGGPLHYVVGLPATNIPTSGTGSYSMIGATTPSVTGSFTNASVSSSSLSINFGTFTGTFNASWSINGGAITATATQPMSLSGSQLSSTSFATITTTGGSFCSSLGIAGFLAGDQAARAGMAYHLNMDGNSVNGAIAYKKN